MSKLLAIALLLPLWCRAQVGVEMPICYQHSGVPGPQSIAGLAYYWVSSDIPVGWTVGANGASSTNWVDRIQSAIWTNGNSGELPTNSAAGVHFEGAQALTNLVLKTTSSTVPKAVMFVIANFEKITPDADVFSDFNNAVGLMLVAGVPQTVRIYNETTTLFLSLTNIIQDWVFNVNNGNASATGLVPTYWTNGVWTGANGTMGNGGAIGLFWLGHQTSRGYLRALVSEIAWYTNGISTNDLTTLHNYAKTTYGVTP